MKLLSRMRSGIAGAVATAAIALLPACVTVPVCGGSPPSSDAAASLEAHADRLLDTRGPGDLACWAEAGDLVAQFALGRAYEMGHSVPTDRELARRFYEKAARGSPARLVYAPPIPGQKYGQVLAVPGSGRRGLPEAQEALKRLDR